VETANLVGLSNSTAILAKRIQVPFGG